MTIRIEPISDEPGRRKAADLVAQQIGHVRRSQIFTNDDSSAHQFLQEIFESGGKELPRDLWIGAWDAGEFVGALHAGVHVGQAAEIAQKLVNGEPGAGSPGWLLQYVQRCVHVDELAVVASHRGQGIGQGLVAEMHRQALADPQRETRHVTAFASDAAVETFTATGYTIGAPRTPVPSAYSEGLGTKWDPTYDQLAGAYVYRHLSRPGGAFFKA